VNKKLITLIIGMLGLSGPTALRLAAQNQEAPETHSSYDVTALSTLGGYLSTAAGINNKGWVVGDANLAGNSFEHATLWRDGVIVDLGTLGGPNSSIGFIGASPNETGLITGNAQSATVDPLGEYWGVNYGCDVTGTVACQGWQYLGLGFTWKDGVITPLPTLGGNYSASLGRANQRGEIVGTAETPTPDPGCIGPQVLDWKPVVWEPNGEVRELAPFPGDSVGAASAINVKGQVVGGSGICESPGTQAIVHAVLWENGIATNLGSLGGVINNFAVSINDQGQVVGLSDLVGDGTSHAFLWQNGIMTDLGTLSGDFSSVACEINNRGQVVGQSCDVDFNCRGFLWEDGKMMDLNTVIPAASPLYLIDALGINDRGEIVGGAFVQSTGDAPAFLAIPCDEQHAGVSGCNDLAALASAVPREKTSRSKVVLPEIVRNGLLKRKTFGGLRRGLAIPR
jgi:probable HAF family extracellular repeat protein